MLHCASYGFGFIHRLDVASSGLVLAATTFQGLLWLHLGQGHLQYYCIRLSRPSETHPIHRSTCKRQFQKAVNRIDSHLASSVVLCSSCFPYCDCKCFRRVSCPLLWVGPPARTRDRCGCHRPRMAKGFQDCHRSLDGNIGRDS